MCDKLLRYINIPDSKHTDEGSRRLLEDMRTNETHQELVKEAPA